MNPVLEEIKPETAERLAALAKEKGVSVDEYLRSLLPGANGAEAAAEAEMSPAEIDRILDELAAIAGDITPLPRDFSREDIYSDHD